MPDRGVSSRAASDPDRDLRPRLSAFPPPEALDSLLAGGAHDDWLTPYVDVMTLLLAMFVMLYAFSYVGRTQHREAVLTVAGDTRALSEGRVEKGRPGKPQARRAAMEQPQQTRSEEVSPQSSPSDRPEGPRPDQTAQLPQLPSASAPNNVREALVRSLRSALRRVDGREFLVLDTGPQEIALTIGESVLYDLGSAEIRPRGQRLLTSLAPSFRFGGYHIVVEGHTDDLPIHNSRFPSNWELSSARASSVVRFLIDSGVSPARLQAVGYADTRPVASNDSPSGRRQNRRVTLVLEITAREAQEPVAGEPAR